MKGTTVAITPMKKKLGGKVGVVIPSCSQMKNDRCDTANL